MTTDLTQTVLNPAHIGPQTGSESTGYYGGQSGFGTAHGDITYGEIKGYGHGQATGFHNIGGISSGQGSLFGAWQDTLTVTSSTLPTGAPVSLLLTLSIDATLAGTSGATTDLTSTLQLGSFAVQITTSSLGGFHEVQTVIVDTSVGAVLPAFGSLYIIAQTGDFPSTSEFADVDASHTALFRIDTMTPQATYTTASGYSYFTSTPEPSTLLLLGSGLIGALARVKGSHVSQLQQRFFRIQS